MRVAIVPSPIGTKEKETSYKGGKKEELLEHKGFVPLLPFYYFATYEYTLF